MVRDFRQKEYIKIENRIVLETRFSFRNIKINHGSQ